MAGLVVFDEPAEVLPFRALVGQNRVGDFRLDLGRVAQQLQGPANGLGNRVAHALSKIGSGRETLLSGDSGLGRRALRPVGPREVCGKLVPLPLRGAWSHSTEAQRGPTNPSGR